MIQPQVFETHPRIRNLRSAKNATQTRIVRNARARYTAIFRVGATLGGVLVMLMGYVMLTSNVTSLTYSVAKAHADRDALQEQTARLDDRLAALRSQERLAAVAAKLGMRDPDRFASVRIAPPTLAQNRVIPVFSSIAEWFGDTSPRVREH